MTNKHARQVAIELFEKGYQSQMVGALDDAIEQYRKSIEIYPTAEAHTFLGWTYSFLNRYDDAITACKEAIKVDPEYGNPYNDIGAYLIEQGQPDEAIGWFEKAAASKRYDSYCYPYYNMGRVYERRGDWRGALASYEASIKANPEYMLAQKARNRLRGLLN